MKDKSMRYVIAGAVSLFLAGIIVGVTHLPNWVALPMFIVLFAIGIWIVRSS